MIARAQRDMLGWLTTSRVRRLHPSNCVLAGDPYPARSEPESAPCPCWSAGRRRSLGTKGLVPTCGTKGPLCHLSVRQTPVVCGSVQGTWAESSNHG